MLAYLADYSLQVQCFMFHT